MGAKKTPLYDKHIELGGKVVDYSGWFLPVEYTGLTDEHETVRNNVGLFDVSHMGEFDVKGKDALAFINYAFTNDYTNVDDYQIQYTLLCHEDGGIIDDLLIYKYNDEHFLIIPNAANVDKDFAHLAEVAKDFDVEFKNISEEVGEIAIQGPKAQEVLAKVVDYNLDDIAYYHFADKIAYKGYDLLISRTGYTGEDGFEIYGTPEATVSIWDDLLEAGKEQGIKPTGLGCRDTLRFEAAMPLYGNEMADDINPLEAGLKFAVKFDKEKFIGKEALTKINEEGRARKIVGLELEGKRIPRHGYEVQKDGKRIGEITTGYRPPTVGKSIANALVDADSVKLGDEVDVIIHKKPNKATVVSRKFLDKK